MWADAHLALVAAGQEEDCHAQDVIWRQSGGLGGQPAHAWKVAVSADMQWD